MRLPRSVLVWTPVGLVSVLPAESRVLTHPTPQVLRARVTRARQLTPDRVVGLAGPGILAVDGPPVTDRLVILDPSAPADPIDLGDATSWFPSFDGAGIWRVLQRYGGAPLGIRPIGAFEATPFLLTGQQRGPTIALAEGRCPVAATADGLAVQQEVPPGRPYPAHVPDEAWPERGGDTVDLVRYDQKTGEPGTRISNYTMVMSAEPHGLALVTNGDPNVSVRPTEVIDLATGAAVSTDQRPDLSWQVFPQPRTTSRGHGISADLLGPRILVAQSLSGTDRIELTTDLAPTTMDVPPTIIGFRWEQDHIWFDDLLLFAEQAPDGAVLAAWSPTSRETTRFPVTLPAGSYPLGGSVRQAPPG